MGVDLKGLEFRGQGPFKELFRVPDEEIHTHTYMDIYIYTYIRGKHFP